MKSNPLVSIIIPFFNEEAHLQRAVNSVLAQTYSPIEVILVNDGSTDNSKAIAQEYTSKYSHIYLINSANESLGAARNKGVNKAKGAFITFLDADDALKENMLYIMVNGLLESKSSLAICQFTLLDSNGIPLQANYNKNSIEVSSIDAIKAIYTNNISSTAWGKVYTTSIIKSIKAPEKIWFEDDSFVLETFLNSNKVLIINKPLLTIYSRKNSIVRRLITVKRIQDLNTSFILQLQLLKTFKTNLKDDTKVLKKLLFKYYYSRLLNTFILFSLDRFKLSKIKKASMEKTYFSILRNTKKSQKEEHVLLSFKTKMLVNLLMLPKYIGWYIPQRLLYVLKPKVVKKIKRLRA